MNIKELVAAVSVETNIPAAQVRKVTIAVLGQFSQLIESKGNFKSSVLTIAGVVIPAKPATDEKPERPERKMARMRIGRKKGQEKAEGDSAEEI